MCDDLWCVRVCDSQSPPKKASAFRLSLGRVECIRPMLLDVAVRYGLAKRELKVAHYSHLMCTGVVRLFNWIVEIKPKVSFQYMLLTLKRNFCFNVSNT